MTIEYTIVKKENFNSLKPSLMEYFSKAVRIQEPEKRVKQVIAVAKKNDEIIAVATAYRQFNPRIRESFLFYRSSVAPEARQQSVSRELIKVVLDYCNQEYRPGYPVGLFFEVENETIMKNLRSPIWKSGAVLVGYDKHNRQQRAIYFDRAELGHAPTASAKEALAQQIGLNTVP